MDLTAFKFFCSMLIDSSNHSPDKKIQLKKLLHDFEPEHRRVNIKTGNSEMLLIDTISVLSVEAKKKCSVMTLLINGHVSRIDAKLPLWQMEQLLGCSYIMKVHGSYLVNLNMCQRYHSSNEQLELIIAELIPVSRDLKMWMPHVLSDLH
ncbi:hypothetical protein LBMAG27_24620 [Bacteroidota bacterium]|nr:hypothetical protein LBMAG27_24620 [Bacteroidota bacterium]